MYWFVSSSHDARVITQLSETKCLFDLRGGEKKKKKLRYDV